MHAPEIAKMLVLSTAHLPEWIAAHPQIGTDNIIMSRPEGFVCYVSTHDGSDGVLNDEMLAVMRHAAALDCTYVMFDRDGDTTPDLPTFDW